MRRRIAQYLNRIRRRRDRQERAAGDLPLPIQPPQRPAATPSVIADAPAQPALQRLASYFQAASRDADGGEAERLRLMARHYAACAERVAAQAGFAGAAAEDFPADDESRGFVDSVNVYVPGGEAEIAPERRAFPWAHLFSDPACGIFLVGGQSNAANHGDRLHRPRGDAYALNFMDLRCYAAGDPLPGASGNGGSIWSRLSDLLLERGFYERILFVPVAFGGTYVKDWISDGRTRRRLTLTLSRLRKRLGSGFLDFDAVFWQQGEAEANLTDMSAEAYAAEFRELTALLRANGVFCPILVAQSTLCEGPHPHPFRNHAAIREGQAQLADAAQGILRGPDTDVIGGEGRRDGCHFAAAGLERAAALWLDAIDANRHLLRPARRCSA